MRMTCGLILVAIACSEASLVRVHVCGDLTVPDDVDALRISFFDEDANELEAGVVELARGQSDGGEPERLRRLPLDTVIRRASGSGFCRVKGLLQGVEVARFDRRVFVLEALDRVDLALTERCYGILCPLGQTCVKGSCVQAPEPGESPSCTKDEP